MSNFKVSKTSRVLLFIIVFVLLIGAVGGVLASIGSNAPSKSGNRQISSNASSTSSAIQPINSPSTPQYTLAYSLGEYATGSVPESVTANSGSSVNVSFDCSVSKISDSEMYFFCGWAYTDGSEYTNFSLASDDNSLTLDQDYTLYPVFCQYRVDVAFYNDNGLSADLLIDLDGGYWATVSSGNCFGTYFELGHTYNLRYLDYGSYSTFFRDSFGTVDELSFDEDGYLLLNGSKDWVFNSADEICISCGTDIWSSPVIEEEVTELQIVNELLSETSVSFYVYYQYPMDGEIIGNSVAYASSEGDQTITIERSYSYSIGISDDQNISAYYSGYYNGQYYSAQSLTVSGTSIYDPDGNQTWTFDSSGSFTLRVVETSGSVE